ncbi:MAG: hypothetical protein AVDCRST_MAG70-1269 [uncultured Thermomicrobiales bacterium]|uniref:Secreted protein n=1 Tax=uncultured Thermomicrobiales bacterium TaxID=1645740 RepID=A0A6J4UQW7_9BACT|nr:MAG: hypothetical protein AVDCRST_MAG70-1269 [uncultured Thermomicrobiales bacterium]
MKALKTLVVGSAVALGIAIAAPVSASHEHYLDTPGTCVIDIASGQTEQGQGEAGFHQFHTNVHLGQPGMVAFVNPSNPVSVGKGVCP